LAKDAPPLRCSRRFVLRELRYQSLMGVQTFEERLAMREHVYLAGAVRTAIGAFNGSLANVTATVLGSAVIREALSRASVAGDCIDEVIMGNVLSAGLGQNPARQASIGAGLPIGVGATTIGKVCGSGLKAIMLAAQAIQCHDASVVVAGGMENMSRAPYLLTHARNGYRMGNAELIDSMLHDGLTDAYGQQVMGCYADACADKYGFSRKEQDDFAVASFQRARAATEKGIFAREIVPVAVPASKGSVSVTEDEQPRRFNEEKLRQLRPAFGTEGTVTAGNSSSINDGAAAVVALSEEAVKRLGVKPVARIIGYAASSQEPPWFTTAPINAVRKLLGQLDISVGDVDVFEVNEAFAVVAMAAMKELGISHIRLNIHGGAVALGHPIGASGARTLVTLLNALETRNARRGIVTLCIGGGEAVAMAVERCG
jgi:acetyl-CoA C-acetyltransferase